MKINNFWKVLIPLIILFGFYSIPKENLNKAAPVHPNNILVSPYSLEQSIIKGVQFLEENQLPNGEFPTYRTRGSNCSLFTQYESSIYITTYILYSMQFVEDMSVEWIINKGVNYLQNEMEYPGVWRFYNKKRDNIYHNDKVYEVTEITLYPDLDDTAVASFCLKQNGELPENAFNESVFFNNRNEEGLYYTWLMDFPPHRENEEHFRNMSPDQNDICPGVNCNVLLYLGDKEETEKLSDYLIEIVTEGIFNDYSYYFPNTYIFYYLYSRAYYNGAYSLEMGKDVIIERLKTLQKADGSYGNPLKTALVACTFFNFNYYGMETYLTIENILNDQREDGGWQVASFFTNKPDGLNYGSAELSTAIALEAISRFKDKLVVIEATVGEGGSIEPYGELGVVEGTDQTFTITADDGYKIADVLINGESIGKINSYTFEAIDKNHTIHAVFESKAYPPHVYAGLVILIIILFIFAVIIKYLFSFRRNRK